MLCYLLFHTHLLLATERRVVFTVGVTALSSTWQGHILVFPHVVTNKGNVYNRSTGKFTAPIDGTYVFFVAVNAYGNKIVYLDIVHNGSSKVRTLSHSSASHMTGTNMAVLQLDKGLFGLVGTVDKVIGPILCPLLPFLVSFLREDFRFWYPINFDIEFLVEDV